MWVIVIIVALLLAGGPLGVAIMYFGIPIAIGILGITIGLSLVASLVTVIFQILEEIFNKFKK